MVYERLPIQIHRHDFERLNNPRNASSGSYSYAIVSNSINLSILATSKQINAEAMAIMRAKMNHILNAPPRMMVDLSSTSKIHKCGGPLWHISHYLAKRAVAARKHLGSVPYVGTGMRAGGLRYTPGNDPQYLVMARLVETWFRGLDHQRKSASHVGSASPAIELALIAPQDWSQEAVNHALRQLAYVLFAEHGAFHFQLRCVGHLYPERTQDMRRQERALVDKVMWGRGGDAVRAVPGAAVEHEEYEAEWSENSFLLL